MLWRTICSTFNFIYGIKKKKIVVNKLCVHEITTDNKSMIWRNEWEKKGKKEHSEREKEGVGIKRRIQKSHLNRKHKTKGIILITYIPKTHSSRVQPFAKKTLPIANKKDNDCDCVTEVKMKSIRSQGFEFMSIIHRVWIR